MSFYQWMPSNIPHMMTSSNGNIFRVTGPLCGEFIGHRWIPLTKASDTELWFFFDMRLNKRLSKQSWGWWFETPSFPLWRQCNGIMKKPVWQFICTVIDATLWKKNAFHNCLELNFDLFTSLTSAIVERKNTRSGFDYQWHIQIFAKIRNIINTF